MSSVLNADDKSSSISVYYIVYSISVYCIVYSISVYYLVYII